MGNKISNNPPLNEVCPICYEEKEDNIILECGHKYDRYCIQRSCIEYINSNQEQKCPYCRKKISFNNIKKIFESWVISEYKPIHWMQYNTCFLKKNIKIVKLNAMLIKNNKCIYKIIVPYYKHNNFKKPLFFHSPDIYNIKIVQNDIISNDNNLNMKYQFAIDGMINSRNWCQFLELNFKNRPFRNTNMYDVVKFSKNKMRFHITDLENMIVYNQRDGTMQKGFCILPQTCTFLFRMYIIIKHDDIYLINELYSILYK